MSECGQWRRQDLQQDSVIQTSSSAPTEPALNSGIIATANTIVPTAPTKCTVVSKPQS